MRSRRLARNHFETCMCREVSGPIQLIPAIRNNKKPFLYSTAHIDDHFCALGCSGE